MNELIDVEIVPTRNSLHCPFCAYAAVKEVREHNLEIQWDETERLFKVKLVGKDIASSDLADALWQHIPVEVARNSTCVCGGTLELGSYSMSKQGDDFIFAGEYFCPSCKRKQLAKKSGIRGLLQKWAHGLTKVEIKPTGVTVERKP